MFLICYKLPTNLCHAYLNFKDILTPKASVCPLAMFKGRRAVWKPKHDNDNENCPSWGAATSSTEQSLSSQTIGKIFQRQLLVLRGIQCNLSQLFYITYVLSTRNMSLPENFEQMKNTTDWGYTVHSKLGHFLAPRVIFKMIVLFLRLHGKVQDKNQVCILYTVRNFRLHVPGLEMNAALKFQIFGLSCFKTFFYLIFTKLLSNVSEFNAFCIDIISL